VVLPIGKFDSEPVPLIECLVTPRISSAAMFLVKK
jgi:hypothetical protein